MKSLPSVKTTIKTNKHITKVVNHLANIDTQIKELQARRESAREILKEHVGFESKSIQTYEIERSGSIICKIETLEVERFDIIKFREENPALAAKFAAFGTRTTIETL